MQKTSKVFMFTGGKGDEAIVSAMAEALSEGYIVEGSEASESTIIFIVSKITPQEGATRSPLSMP